MHACDIGKDPSCNYLLTLANYMEIIKIVNFTALGLKAVPRMINAKAVLLFLAVHMTP